MPYIMEICKAGRIYEVSKYHTYKYNCKGGTRRKHEGTTSAKQEDINNKVANKNLRRLLNNNFCNDDFLIEFDFKKEHRPRDSIEMGKIMKNVLRELRKEYKAHNTQLKYVYVKEIGPKGAAHIHMMINNCADLPRILKKVWKLGGIHIDPLHTDGQYEAIANYFIKYANKTIQTEGRLIGKRWNPSKNLVRPVVKKIRIKRVNTFLEKIKDIPGYYLEKDSVLSGLTADGYGYFSYSLHRIRDDTDSEEDIGI